MRRNTFIVTILGLFFLKGIAITSNVVGCRTCGGGGGGLCIGMPICLHITFILID